MKKDVFDRIMDTKALSFAKPFCEKHREQLLYLFFGALTTLVSIVSFWALNVALGVNELFANAVSWILAVLFAFATNRKWVFDGKGAEGTLMSQMGSFFAGRLLTLFLEEAIIFVFVTKLSMNSMLIKIIATVVVIILNYFISKFFVFRRNG